MKTQLLSTLSFLVYAFLVAQCHPLPAADPSPLPAPKPSFTYHAVVVRVIDGDTVKLDIDLGFGVWMRNHSIRLLGVHAPELFSGNDRAAGAAAKAALEKMIPAGSDIVLQSMKDRTDKYGRYLGQLWNEQGEDVNAAMLKLPQGGK